MKIFLKVFTSYLILILLTIAVLDFFLMPKINRLMTDRIEDEMMGMARMMTLIPREYVEGKVPELAKLLNVRITLIDAAGRVTAESDADRKIMDNHLDRPEIQQAAAHGQGKAIHFSSTLKESMLYVALPLTENSEIVGFVRLSRPLVMVSKSLDHLNWAIYMTLYIITLPSLLLAFFFSRKIYHRLIERDTKKREIYERPAS
jgi:two-component system phosphate regulon sensor histidine kinase PhoR